MITEPDPAKIIVLGGDPMLFTSFSFLCALERQGLVQIILQDVGDTVNGMECDILALDELIKDQSFKIEAEQVKNEKQAQPGDKPWLRKKKGRGNFGRYQ